MVLDPNATPAQVGKPEPTAPAAANAGNPPAGQPGSAGQPSNDQKMVPLTALHEERAKYKELRDELDALKSRNTFQGQQGQQGPQYQQGQQYQQQAPVQQGPTTQQLDEMWDQDPRTAFRQEMRMALNWYDQTNAALDTQEDDVATKHQDFNNYRGEVRKYLRTLQPHQRSAPGVVEMAYYLVKGQKADDLVSLSKEELISKIRAGEFVQGMPQGGVGSPQETPSDIKPTKEQYDAARAFGQPIEEYMKHVVARR